jgi:outer membrane protein OmpA-like peptidoglycan-associated protein
MTIEISGHTDNISSKSFNKELSKKRANSVANYLIKKGIDRKRFTTEGFGYSKPIADNKTEKGRQKNRRVEFKILTK